MTEGMGLNTTLVHAGDPNPRIAGAVVTPVFQSSTYLYGGDGGGDTVRYIRYNNTPNHDALNAKIAALERADAAAVTASGMAAISTALLSVLASGDHLLAQASLYGGTYSFITDVLPSLGVETSFIDAHDPSSWETALRRNTRAVYVETVTNPLQRVPALDEIARFAARHGLVSLVDNTFATPINFRPAEHGFDLSLHSATKYLNGHDDIVAGAVAGRAGVMDRVRSRLTRFGGSLDPHACFLLARGVKTLALRFERQSATAAALAKHFEGHPAVTRVHYPGLASHADHARASSLLGGFGAMLAIEVADGGDAAKRLLRALRIATVAPSLGGVETLVSRPVETSHAGVDPAQREAMGITDALVRISVGIEDLEDLVGDFESGLAA